MKKYTNFEDIKKVDDTSIEFWSARELMEVLGYSKWENFEQVIQKAKKACIQSKQKIENHFPDIRKMVLVGSNTERNLSDYKLDRYACYLIAQNGDPAKIQIAHAQTYFAVQTRRQEIFDKLSEAEKRIFIRGEVSSENKKLFSTAKHAGVTNFGSFNDAGYRGLYGMPLADIENRKNIQKGELLDRAGATELAANLFRITQTDDKLKKDKTKSGTEATKTHRVVGEKVRKTIRDIGGELPENITPERHIKEIRREIKSLEKKQQKRLPKQLS